MHPLTRRWSIGCLAVAALSAVAIYQWQCGEPWPPRNVDGSYTFVWKPWLDRSGPGNKGSWFGCRRTQEPGLADCTIIGQHGTALLHTAYKTCSQQLLPPGPLRVDGQTTRWLDGVGLFRAGTVYNYAPFIHLEGGEVLLPADAFPAALKKYREDRTQPPC